MTQFFYNGPHNRSYPGHFNPETGAVLQGEHPWNDPEEDGDRVPFLNEPGEPIEFGDQLPPADGFWYDAGTGLPYIGEPIAPEPASVGDAPLKPRTVDDPPGTAAGKGEEE
jgi:hypothetical protein